MHPFVAVVASAVSIALVIWFLHNSARSIQSTRARQGLGAVMIVVGIALMFARAFAVAVPLLVVGIGLILPRGSSPGKAPKASTSQVRSAHLEMTLDHQTGEIDGRILTGSYEGQRLSDLTMDNLLRYHRDVQDDRDTIRLLEAYLEKTFPDWRDHAEQATAPGSDQMSLEDAYRLLGLDVGASEEEIREAYNRLIKRVHPDQGGSAALTAQITEARDRLLGD